MSQNLPHRPCAAYLNHLIHPMGASKAIIEPPLEQGKQGRVRFPAVAVLSG